MSRPGPTGIGAGKPEHPFAVTVEAPVAVRFCFIFARPYAKISQNPGGEGRSVVILADLFQNAIVPDGYGIKYHAYHTM